eukprot:4396295-Amphidinium_carterae.1
MLRHLAAYCTWLQKELSLQFPSQSWRHGVHANPSCKQLHIHMLSQDFSTCFMDSKRRWNSFQSPFLVPLHELIQNLEGGREGALGGLDVASADLLLKADIKCQGCGACFGSKLQALKKHLGSCRAMDLLPPPLLMIAELAEQDDAVHAPREASGSSAIQVATFSPTVPELEDVRRTTEHDIKELEDFMAKQRRIPRRWKGCC